jgi:hypothetical protein
MSRERKDRLQTQNCLQLVKPYINLHQNICSHFIFDENYFKIYIDNNYEFAL